MAQSGYTPILIYASGTATNVPLAANMTSSSAGAELALNYADGKLYFKNSSGVVTLLASNAATTNVASITFGTTGLTPSTATTGAVTVAGTLAVANGGTGVTTSTGSGNNVLSTSPTITTPVISSLSSASATALTLQSAGTTAITVDTSQNVGIGTASPSQKLEVAGNVLLSNNQYYGVKDTTGAAVGFPIYTGSNDAIFGYLASGTTGISTYQFRSGNNVERMRIDSSGNVGIGTSSPSGFKLYINGASKTYGIATFDGATYAAQDYTVAGTHKGYVATANAIIGGGSANDLAVDASVGNLILATGDTERMRILSTGNILSLSGGSTTATGTGIAFPATQSASSDANTLDDYEEGTWSPVLVPASGSITTQTNTGSYTKIGRQVTVTFACNIDNVGTATTLSSMSGLPFAATSIREVGAGRENSVTGLMWSWITSISSSSLIGQTYANSYTIATNYLLRGTVTYFV